MISYNQTLEHVKKICEQLEAGNTSVTDDEVRDAYRAMASRMQSNCDSVAQGLLTIIAGLCAHRPNLASEFLPDALQSLYYLGIEDLEGIKKYIKWLIEYDQPYHGRATQSGYNFLRGLFQQDKLLIEAFRVMYSREDNEWRKENPSVPNVPLIFFRNEKQL